MLDRSFCCNIRATLCLCDRYDHTYQVCGEVSILRLCFLHDVSEYVVMKNILKRLRTKDYIVWEMLNVGLVTMRFEFYDL
jgi:hypothetical protein